jgi:hypothetical protein
MSKKKRVSINALDKVWKEEFTNTTTQIWHGVEFEVKRTIGMTEMLEFVDDVTKSCFQENGGFLPEVIEFAVRSNLVLKYTNLSLPDALEHRYALLYETDLVDVIQDAIDQNQFIEIHQAVYDKVEHLCRTNAIEVQNRLGRVVTAFESVQEQLEQTFSGISQEDVTNLTKALTGGGFDADQVVRSYLEQTRREGDEP